MNVGPAFTVNAPDAVTLPASGFVIVKSRALVVAPDAIVTFAVRCVASVKLVEFTVIPLPLNVTAAPLTKPVPTIAKLWLAAPCPRLDGLTDVNVGAPLTVNAPVAVIAPAPLAVEFVIVKSRAPVVAPDAIVTFAVKCVASVKLVEFTVMPLPLNVTAAPEAKFVPTIARFWLVAFCPRLDGVTDVNVGPASTVNAPDAVTLPASGFVIVKSRASVLAP